jgi:hypothetical protein
MTTTLTRQPMFIVPVDAATVAISVPGYQPGDDATDRELAQHMAVAHTGADGAYGVYAVLDGAGNKIGIEVVISCPEADRVFEGRLLKAFGGWVPDVSFYRRRSAGEASQQELNRYHEYVDFVSRHYGAVLDEVVRSVDPLSSAVPVRGPDLVVTRGRLAVGDPFCSMVPIEVLGGTYCTVLWKTKQGQPTFGDGTLRVGAYMGQFARS